MGNQATQGFRINKFAELCLCLVDRLAALSFPARGEVYKFGMTWVFFKTSALIFSFETKFRGCVYDNQVEKFEQRNFSSATFSASQIIVSCVVQAKFVPSASRMVSRDPASCDARLLSGLLCNKSLKVQVRSAVSKMRSGATTKI